MNIHIGDVVQFIEHHKWCGCLGIVTTIRQSGMMMIGVPIPKKGTAYILAQPYKVELIGRAVMIPQE